MLTDRQTDGHHQSISRNCFAIRPKKDKIIKYQILTIIHFLKIYRYIPNLEFLQHFPSEQYILNNNKGITVYALSKHGK